MARQSTLGPIERPSGGRRSRESAARTSSAHRSERRMTQYLLKIVVSAVIIVAVSEMSKRSTTLGALLASLPLVSVLGMVWLHVETGDDGRVADLAADVFWLVLPSLALFLIL